VSALTFRERPAAGQALALLVLHHGRGTDELDMMGLGEALDPQRQAHLVAPRAPLRLPGSAGWHWYVVPRVGYPDPHTFHAAYQRLGELHEELWQRTGIAPARTVLGGFSMGAVMSYATGLGPDRPAVGGIMAFSGFIPTVEGWAPSLGDRPGVRVFIAHGSNDPVIDVAFARRAREQLTAGGLDVDYHESAGGHEINAAHLRAAASWLDALASASPDQP
jgi:phospholipase/carboxylesterase